MLGRKGLYIKNRPYCGYDECKHSSRSGDLNVFSNKYVFMAISMC